MIKVEQPCLPTVRDRARQQNVNFLMFDLVTGLPALILLLGLFCGRECRVSRWDRSPGRAKHEERGRGRGYLVEGGVHCPQLRQPAVGHVTHRVCGREDGHGLQGQRQ